MIRQSEGLEGRKACRRFDTWILVVLDEIFLNLRYALVSSPCFARDLTTTYC